MSMNDAGRIGFVLKGDYDSNTTSELLDVVKYAGCSYAAKGTTTGNLPTNTLYWQAMTEGAGVSSFNSRTGAVSPTKGDYTADQVGAVGLVSGIEIDGTTELPYDFNSYNGTKPGNYFKTGSGSMSHAPTGLGNKDFKMTVEQIKDENSLGQQCKQTVIFCDVDEDTEPTEVFRYYKYVMTWNDPQHQSGSAVLAWTDWFEVGERGHVIVNSSGTDMAQRNKLKFSGLNVTDDSSNDQTIITAPVMTGATAGAAGSAGMCSTPGAGDQDKVWGGNGLWVPKTNPDMISDAYNAASAYAVGDFCIYNNTLYRAKLAQLANENYPPTNTSYWEATNVGDELVGLNSQLVEQKTLLYTSPTVTSVNGYITSDYIYPNVSTAQYRKIYANIIRISDGVILGERTIDTPDTSYLMNISGEWFSNTIDKLSSSLCSQIWFNTNNTTRKITMAILKISVINTEGTSSYIGMEYAIKIYGIV